MTPDLNYLAILVAGLLSMVLGSVWYSPLLFGNIWMRGMKMKESEMKKDKMMMSYGIGFLLSLLMIYILAHYVSYMEASLPSEGAEVAFWLWLGFVVPVSAGTVLWEGKPFSLFAINVGFYLVNMLMAAIILAVW